MTNTQKTTRVLPCPECKGRKVFSVMCSTCKGEGHHHGALCRICQGERTVTVTCTTCKGSGEVVVTH